MLLTDGFIEIAWVRQMRSVFGMATLNILDSHGKGSATGARASLATMSSSLSSIWFRTATATRPDGCTTGGTVSSVAM